MKILALNFNNFIPKTYAVKKHTPQFASDSFQLSFNGYVDDAMDSSDIHCPVCGTKMLTQKDFESLLEKAAQVESSADFKNLLTEYEDYIPANMKRLLKSFKSERDFSENIIRIRAYANARHAHRIKSAKEILTEYADKLPDDEKKSVTDVISSISDNEKSFYYTKKLLPLLRKDNILNEDRLRLKKTVNYVKDSSECVNMCAFKNLENYSISDVSVEFAKRIFRNSILNKNMIIKREGSNDEFNNEILVCSSCLKKSSNSNFLTADALDKPDFKTALSLYIKDISKIIGAKNQQPNASYVRNLVSSIKLLTGKWMFVEDEYSLLKKFNFLAARHASFAPIEQDKVDIHCAGCGTVVMPYIVREKLQKDMNKSMTIKDYLYILNKYDKYIGEYTRFIADDFKKIAEENPDIKQSDFLKILREKVDKHSWAEIEKAKNNFSKQRKYIVKTRSLDELYLFDNILSIFNRYKTSGKLNDFSYEELYEEIFEAMKSKSSCPSAIYTFLTDIEKICTVNWLVKINDNDIIRDKSPMHTVVFNIFKPDFASADHLVARSKKGNDTKDNLIGLCKFCNSVIKDNKSVFSWLKTDSRIKYNLVNHIKDVEGMAKAGMLEGYDDWAETIVNSVYDETNGKYDLRDKI